MLQSCALNSFHIPPTFSQELFSSLKINFETLPLEQVIFSKIKHFFGSIERYYLAWLVCILGEESCPQASFIFETLSDLSEDVSDFIKAKLYETWLFIGEKATFQASASMKAAYIQLSLENEDKNKRNKYLKIF